MIRRLLIIAPAIIATITTVPVFAKGKSGYSPGTGASSSSHSVHGYTKKDGTYVAPHRSSNADGKSENNWTTKGNTNPYTGQAGTRDPYGQQR